MPPPSRVGPPPSRIGLPPIAPPPRKTASSPPLSAALSAARPPQRSRGSTSGEVPYDELAQTVTAVASPHAQPTRKGDPRAEVDLDWSDEEESTHVYGKGEGEDEQDPPQPPRGPHDMPSVIAPPAPMSAPSLREPSSQLHHHVVPHRPPEPRSSLGQAPQRLNRTLSSERSPEGEPSPHQLRETTRGARIVPPALLSSRAAPPGPMSRPAGATLMSRGAPEGLAALQAAEVTESLPQAQSQQGQSQQAAQEASQAHFPLPRTDTPARPPPMTPQAAPAARRPEQPATHPSFRPAASAPLAAPAQEPQRKLGVIVVAAAAVAVALLAVFFLLRRPGELVVDVRDAKGTPLPRAEIFVDGRKVCDSTPCVVSDLAPGARLVKAAAPGFQTPAAATAQISAGQRGELVITLALSTGTLVAKGDQPGVKVYVDGVDRGALPAKLDDLQPGPREVRFDGGERYKSLEKIVDLTPGDVTDLGSVRLDVLRGQITIELGGDDARVTIQKDQEATTAKVVAGPFPKTIELDGGAKWRVVASKRGMPDYVARFDFSDGVAVKTVRISMDPEKPAEEPVVAAAEPPPPAPQPGPATPAPPREKTPPKEKDPPKEEPKETASGTGKVNINSIPVSRVLVDGSPMGETPLSGVQLPAGLHTVTFIHPELGRKSVVVKVEPGKTVSASARLRD